MREKIVYNKRTIQLTHYEIEIIKTALQYVYDTKLDAIAKNRKIFGTEVSSKLLATANMYFDVQDVFDGERDV